MDLRGMIVLILASGLTMVLVVGVAAPAFLGRPLGEFGSQTLSTILGMVIGVISAYVANGVIHRIENRPPPVDEVEPGLDVTPWVEPPFHRVDIDAAPPTKEPNPNENGSH
jgi:hypothetical protein